MQNHSIVISKQKDVVVVVVVVVASAVVVAVIAVDSAFDLSFAFVSMQMFVKHRFEMNLFIIIAFLFIFIAF